MGNPLSNVPSFGLDESKLFLFVPPASDKFLPSPIPLPLFFFFFFPLFMHAWSMSLLLPEINGPERGGKERGKRKKKS